MLLVSADWVVPVSRPPVRNGAVLVDGTRIADVGALDELAAAHPQASREHFAGGVITPGLVNAHTHLALTALSGVVEPLPFAEWLPKVVAAMKPWDVADHEASGIIGAEECLRSGVTVVGDIAYGAAEVASASKAGLGGVYYWEVLGVAPDKIPAELARLHYPAAPSGFGARVRCGLSPHSPYTSGPGLLRALHDTAGSLGVPCAIHVAESQAEVDLLRDGSGPLAGVASRTAVGFAPPGTTTVRYLDGLGALNGTTAVHLCYVTANDITLLAEKTRGGVTCPRSNHYLGNPAPRVARLLGAGLSIGVGTDSAASNTDLDLMAEVRDISAAEPELPAPTLFELATISGARAIGVEEDFGSLDAGKQADLAIFSVHASEEPLLALVRAADRSSARAVMSGGVWRVREGELLAPDRAAAARASDATARSRAVLGEE